MFTAVLGRTRPLLVLVLSLVFFNGCEEDKRDVVEPTRRGPRAAVVWDTEAAFFALAAAEIVGAMNRAIARLVPTPLLLLRLLLLLLPLLPLPLSDFDTRLALVFPKTTCVLICAKDVDATGLWTASFLL